MAKSKNSTALFEVIQKDKRFARHSTATPLKTPAWFKTAPAPAPPRVAPAPPRVAPAPPRVAPAAAPTAPAAPAPLPPVVKSVESTPPKPAKSYAAAKIAQPVDDVSASPGPSFAIRASALRVSAFGNFVPACRRAVRASRAWVQANRAGYVPAAAGCAVAVLIFAAVMIFRPHSPAQPIATDTQTAYVPTWQLRQGPAHPSVLDISNATQHRGTSPATRPSSSTASASAIPGEPEPAAATVAPAGQRVTGQNYVIIGTYGDEKIANEAHDFLGANGVPCTIEHQIPNWSSSNRLYFVVGLDGFEGTKSNPSFREYFSRLDALSAKFAPHGGYKAFTPMALKWK